MATKLQCEICGGKLVGKPGGIFECENCGTEYSTAWAKEKIQEITGTVQVEGTVQVTGKVQIEGPVKIESGGATADSLVKRGMQLLGDNREEAKKLFDRALEIDPENGGAFWGLYLRDRLAISLEDALYWMANWSSLGDRNGNLSRAKQYAKGDVKENIEKLEDAWRKLDQSDILSPEMQEMFYVRRNYTLFRKEGADQTHNLKSVTIPGAVKSIGDNAFRNCSILEQVIIQEGVQSIDEDAFSGCSALKTITIPKSVEEIRDRAFEDCFSLESVTMQEGMKSIGGSAFFGCDALKTVTIPKSVRKIEDNAFTSKCLTVITNSGSYAEKYAKQNCIICKTVKAGEDLSKVQHSILKEKKSILEEEKKLIPIRQTCSNLFTGLIDGSEDHTVALRMDGTVLATGSNYSGQCNVDGWTNIVSITTGDDHTVGLHADGTAAAVGDNDAGQCEVSDWRGIIDIAAGSQHTVGLRTDGTVVAIGDNRNGQCDVYNWQNIVKVAANGSCTLGLCADGTVVATGDNKYGQCDVSEWKDIIAISAGDRVSSGLHADGTVVTTEYLGKEFGNEGWFDTSFWERIVAINGAIHPSGMRDDGCIVYSYKGKLMTWNDKADVIAFHQGINTFLLHSSGALTVKEDCYANDQGQCDITGWKLFDNLDSFIEKRKQIKEGFLALAERIEAERKNAEEAERRRQVEAERRRQEKIKKVNQQIAAKKQDKRSAEVELANLKGLFTGRRRKELEAEIAKAEEQLAQLTGKLQELQ